MPTSIDQLIAQREEIERKIAEMQRESRSSAIQEIRALISEFGLTATDLGVLNGPHRAKRSTSRDTTRSGMKIAAKYRDVQSGKTWSGRGSMPNWLKAAINAGSRLEDFAV